MNPTTFEMERPAERQPVKKRIIVIIIAIVIAAVVGTSLFYFRDRPVGYGVDAVDITSLRVSRVVDSERVDVTNQFDLQKIAEALDGASSYRAVGTHGSYAMRDARWEIDWSTEQGPCHVVLGKDSFWYVSASEGYYKINDPETLIEKIDQLYEPAKAQ